jgi:tRNA pseudouridine synthase 10
MILLKITRELLRQYPLCNHCLGRQFALLIHGVSNESRGSSLKITLTLEAHRLLLSNKKEGNKLLKILANNGFCEEAVKTLEDLGENSSRSGKKCYICDNLFENINEFVEKIADALSEYEFETFLMGIKIPTAIEDREDNLRAEFGIRWGESIRNEFSREIGKKIMKLTNKQVDYRKPDVVAVIEPFDKKITIQVNPLFVYGRYKKFVKKLPQTPSDNYKESIEEIITKPLLEMTTGTQATLHAAGRENADARVLGSGRPFIIEIKNPQKRSIDLKELEKRINQKTLDQIEVSNLRLSTNEEVKRLKVKGQAEKVYRALIRFSENIDDQTLENLEKMLSHNEVTQLTPKRTLRYKSERTRIKYVYDVKMNRVEDNLIEMLIRCQGGLYIKELISGDEDRTTPSVSKIAGTPAECIELDVLDVDEGENKDDKI